MLSAHPSPAGLTLREARRVVVDIGDHDGDGGGSGQAPQLPGHVCGTDHHLIAVLCLAVQVCHGGPDHTCEAGQLSTGSSRSHTQAEPGDSFGQDPDLNRISWISLSTRGRHSSISPTFMALPWTHSGTPTESHMVSGQHLHLTSAQQKGLSPPLLLGTLSPATALVLPVPQEHTAGHKQQLLSPFGHMSKSQLRGEKGTGEKNKPRGLSASQKHPKIFLKLRNGHRLNLLPASLLMKRERVPTAAFPVGYLQLSVG